MRLPLGALHAAAKGHQVSQVLLAVCEPARGSKSELMLFASYCECDVTQIFVKH